MRVLLALTAAALLVSCSSGGTPRERLRQLPFVPSPTAILTADIAQNREAQEEGVIKSLRQTAADDAIVLVPGPTSAKSWLASQKDFPPTSWSPHRVIMSCDGKTGVTTGAIRWGEVDGFYTTIWQFYPKGRSPAEGEWRWVLSYGEGVSAPRAEPDIVQTQVADCSTPPQPRVTLRDAVDRPQGSANDATLGWQVTLNARGQQTVSVAIWTADGWKTALTDRLGEAK